MTTKVGRVHAEAPGRQRPGQLDDLGVALRTRESVAEDDCHRRIVRSVRQRAQRNTVGRGESEWPGIARRTFYKHYGSKEDVLAAVYELATTELLNIRR